MARQLSGGSNVSSSSAASNASGARGLLRPVSQASSVDSRGAGRALGLGMGGVRRRGSDVSVARTEEEEEAELEEEDEGEEGQDERASSPSKPATAKREEAAKEEKESDPFSLRGSDSRKLVEAVRPCFPSSSPPVFLFPPPLTLPFPPPSQTVPQKLYDELSAKLSIVERRRAEDRDKLRELDRLQGEAEEWVKMREKTRSRVAELAGEVKELKREVRLRSLFPHPSLRHLPFTKKLMKSLLLLTRRTETLPSTATLRKPSSKTYKNKSSTPSSIRRLQRVSWKRRRRG